MSKGAESKEEETRLGSFSERVGIVAALGGLLLGSPLLFVEGSVLFLLGNGLK